MREFIAKVPCQHRVCDILINCIWSHHQLETELFSTLKPHDRLDVIRCGFLCKSKRPADSTIGPSRIRPIAHN